MRVAVMATGALGAYFGGRLAEAGHEVHFIARGAHLDAIKRDGLKVESPLGNVHLNQANATSDPKEVGVCVVVVFAVKLWDTEKAGELSKPFVNKDTRLLTMQNGIDSVERLAPILGEGVVCAAPTRISAVITGPGTIAHKGSFANFRCGFMDGRDDERLQALVAEMQKAKVDAFFSKAIRKDLWEKFIFLDGMSGATASTRSTIGAVLADPDTHALFFDLMKEVETIGVTQGIALEGLAEKSLAFAKAAPPVLKASMCEDVERGNRLELDWLQGKVVELGRKHGVPTPANEYVYKILKLLRNGRA